LYRRLAGGHLRLNVARHGRTGQFLNHFARNETERENASEHPGDSACFFLRLVRSTRVPPRGRQLGSHLILSSTGTISSTRLSLFLFFFSLAKLATPLSPGASLRRHGHAPPLWRCPVSSAAPPAMLDRHEGVRDLSKHRVHLLSLPSRDPLKLCQAKWHAVVL
jgi:hypothetical protein